MSCRRSAHCSKATQLESICMAKGKRSGDSASPCRTALVSKNVRPRSPGRWPFTTSYDEDPVVIACKTRENEFPKPRWTNTSCKNSHWSESKAFQKSIFRKTNKMWFERAKWNTSLHKRIVECMDLPCKNAVWFQAISIFVAKDNRSCQSLV